MNSHAYILHSVHIFDADAISYITFWGGPVAFEKASKLCVCVCENNFKVANRVYRHYEKDNTVLCGSNRHKLLNSVDQLLSIEPRTEHRMCSFVPKAIIAVVWMCSCRNTNNDECVDVCLFLCASESNGEKGRERVKWWTRAFSLVLLSKEINFKQIKPNVSTVSTN